MIPLYEVIKNQPGYFKQLCYNDLLLTQYDCPQIERKESFFNERNYISFTLSGKRTFFRHEGSWELTEGKSVFVKKGAHISGKNDGDGWCVMIFFLPDSFLHKFISENKVSLSPAKLQHANEEYVIELNVSDTTRSFFHSMLPYFTMQPQPAGSLVELKFRELLFNILLDPHNVPLLSYLIRNGHHYHNSLQEVMEKNYMFNLSLEQFAKLGNQSLPTYNREFRKIYKTSPAKWLKKKRLDHAGILLATSTNSVQDIAYNSGFENTTHFSRVFKNEFNIAPLQYRKQKQSSANF